MGTRFCFNDYDREMAIVAEVKQDNQRKLIGVGRLVADADHKTAEYAVLVTDDYQGIGLGSLLTDYCLEICQSWKIKRVIAEVAPSNSRMLSVFKHRGFDIDESGTPDVILATKNLGAPVAEVPSHDFA